jgi:WD40 repeat protein
MSMIGTWSSLVLAIMVSAGACGRREPTLQVADRAPVPVVPQVTPPVTPIDAMVAIDAPPPPALDVALDGEAVCLVFRDASKLIAATEEVGTPKSVHEIDTGTGIVGAALAPGACSMARSPDGTLVLTTDAGAGSIPEVDVINVATGKRRSSFSPWPKRVLEYDSGFKLRTRFFSDGDRIALLLANDTPVEATLAIWSMKRKRIITKLPMTSALRDAGESFRKAATPGEALAISDDGRYVAAGNLDGAVHVFDLAQGGKELVLSTGLNIVNAIAFAPGGGWLAATGQGGTMTTFEVPSGKQLARAPSPPECGVAAVSPDGQRIAIGCESDVRKNDFPVYPAPRAVRIYTVAHLWH